MGLRQPVVGLLKTARLTDHPPALRVRVEGFSTLRSKILWAMSDEAVLYYIGQVH